MRSSSAIVFSVTYLTHCDALKNYSAGSGASRLARATDIGPRGPKSTRQQPPEAPLTIDLTYPRPFAIFHLSLFSISCSGVPSAAC